MYVRVLGARQSFFFVCAIYAAKQQVLFFCATPAYNDSNTHTKMEEITLSRYSRHNNLSCPIWLNITIEHGNIIKHCLILSAS